MSDDQEHMTEEDQIPKLSTVIIARNEEDRIKTCIDSVRNATKDIDSEILLIDSNSSDKTVDIAKSYEIKIYRITNDEYCSASAGRYLGTEFATGDAILFVDGDMEISNDWVEDGLQLLTDSSKIAGVSVMLNSRDYIETELKHDIISDEERYYVTKRFGGLGMYDSNVLEKIGGFDPRLPGYEDVDLGYRITEEGYKLVVLPLVGCHHPERPKTPGELVRRWKAGHYFGIGKTIYKSSSNPQLLFNHVYRLRWTLFVPTWLIAGFLATIRKKVLIVWFIFSCINIFYVIRSEGIVTVCKYVVMGAIRTLGAVRGYLAFDPEYEYPLEHVEGIEK